MRRSVPIFTALVAVVLTAPAVTATWSAMGSHEPDNGHDHPGFNYFNAAPPGVQRVYFNAFMTIFDAANPNSGVAETTHEVPTLERAQAILGVWVDCNGDGYVGMVESALWEYSASLLLDTSVCPPTSGTPNSWVQGAHNYNGWVTEFIPVAGPTRDASDDNADQRVYRDPEAMVWGDFGVYDQPASGGTCALNPFPRGTMQSTGGLINYLDCRPGTMEAWNAVLRGQNVGPVAVPGVESVTGPTGLVFPNDDDARGSWADIQTFGDEDSAYSAAYVADCEGDPTFHSGDFFNQTPLGPAVPASLQNEEVVGLNPRTGNLANPTVPGTVNMTFEEALGDCDYTNDGGRDFYELLNEDDFNSVSAQRKREADWNLQFTDVTRGRPVSFLGTPGYTGGVVPGGTAGANQYAGLDRVGGGVGGTAFFNATNLWEGGATLVKLTGPRTVRSDLSNPGIAAPYIVTFYANVGSAVTSLGINLPSGAPAIYGADQCGLYTSGIRNGWECDVQYWYQSPDGSYLPEPFPFARPGSEYRLRDVDCYDGHNNVGVPLGLPAYGATPCPAAPPS